jgi:membrane protease subunit HflK
MAWNEPGGSGRDPWSGGKDQGPPDLDELLRKLSGKVTGIFGGRSSGGGGASSGSAGGGGRRGSLAGFGLLVAIVAIGWLASGFYIVDEGRRGVEQRFGRYADTTMPGLHWHMPFPIETVEVVDVEGRRFVEIGYRSSGSSNGTTNRSVARESLMLTQDENIVDVSLSVQYHVSDPRDYLFNVQDPDLTLKQVTESATREVIGKAKMDFVLTEGRAEIVARIEELGQSTLERYKAGLTILAVNLQDAQPPEEVQAAFADAIKAREDEQRFKNEAEAYSNEIIPKARGGAARQLEEANAYLAQIVAEAEGEAARFNALYAEYEKAPAVTRERLYLETIETVFANSGKVLLDDEKGNNLLYLPLDRLSGGKTTSESDQYPDDGSGISSKTPSVIGGAASQRLRDLARDRDTSRQREAR